MEWWNDGRMGKEEDRIKGMECWSNGGMEYWA